MLSRTLTFVMQVEMIKADSFHARHSTADLKKNETEPEKNFHNHIASLLMLLRFFTLDYCSTRLATSLQVAFKKFSSLQN